MEVFGLEITKCKILQNATFNHWTEHSPKRNKHEFCSNARKLFTGRSGGETGENVNSNVYV